MEKKASIVGTSREDTGPVSINLASSALLPKTHVTCKNHNSPTNFQSILNSLMELNQRETDIRYRSYKASVGAGMMGVSEICTKPGKNILSTLVLAALQSFI